MVFGIPLSFRLLVEGISNGVKKCGEGAIAQYFAASLRQEGEEKYDQDLTAIGGASNGFEATPILHVQVGG
jgi:hypothetical protein